MAKKKQDDYEEVEEKKHSKWQVFLFIIFIPLLFIITAIYIGLTISGVDVQEKISSATSSLPIIGDDNESLKSTNQQQANKELENQIKSLNEKLQKKEDNIQSLEEEIMAKEREIDELKIKIRDSEDEKGASSQEGDGDDEQKDIVSTYEKMKPAKAALIFTELKENEAILLLKALKTDARTKVLEKMDPTVAARYTSLLAEPLSE
ncbi:MotE family protein [Priestia sp. GS2]|uniref:MotE family protein n=1 Tax=Priestia sp. GS2 TaxID=3117403 RepID=UPI002EDB0537